MKQLYLLLITLLVSLSAYAERSGTCGDNLQWKLTDEGVLTITGTGEMTDYSNSDRSPWYGQNIKRIIIEDGVSTIGKDAFSLCGNLTSVTIPNSVTTIGDDAFSNCDDLTSVNIPNGVTTIGDRAFIGCNSLTSINIPNSVTTIGNSTFINCYALTSVTIPNGVTTIGDNTFSYCRHLTSITIPNSVTTIGMYAFNFCKSLTSVTIPNSVTTIGMYAFSDCTKLQKVNIGNSVKSIEGVAFYGCTSLTQISCEAIVPPTCNYDVFAGINKSNCKLIVPNNSIDAYKQAAQWKEFFLIEGSTTGIINNIYNKTENVDVYTINGVKCLSKANVNEINALPKGVYIINGKKIIIK